MNRKKFKELCVKLGRARKNAGYTQEHVAEILAYNRRTISAFERGNINNAVILLFYFDAFPEARATILQFYNGGVLNGKNSEAVH